MLQSVLPVMKSPLVESFVTALLAVAMPLCAPSGLVGFLHFEFEPLVCGLKYLLCICSRGDDVRFVAASIEWEGFF